MSKHSKCDDCYKTHLPESHQTKPLETPSELDEILGILRFGEDYKIIKTEAPEIVEAWLNRDDMVKARTAQSAWNLVEYITQFGDTRELEGRIDELTSLQHYGSPTQSFVKYSEIEHRLAQLTKKERVNE